MQSYHDRSINHMHILDLMPKVFKTAWERKKEVLNEEAQIEIVGAFVVEHTSSLGVIAEQTGMSMKYLRKGLEMPIFRSN